MKRFAPILLAIALAGTAVAQVTAADYQAWRRSEQSVQAGDVRTSYQAWRASEQASYRQLDQFAYQAWRASEQAGYGQLDRFAYQAWRRSEQAVYRAVTAMQRGSVLIIANP